MRTTSESGRSKDLMNLPMPSNGFSVEYLKSVLGQAKANLRPMQGDIPLEDKDHKVSCFVKKSVINILAFLVKYQRILLVWI